MENNSVEEMGDMICCEAEIRLNNWLDFSKIIRRRAVGQTWMWTFCSDVIFSCWAESPLSNVCAERLKLISLSPAWLQLCQCLAVAHPLSGLILRVAFFPRFWAAWLLGGSSVPWWLRLGNPHQNAWLRQCLGWLSSGVCFNFAQFAVWDVLLKIGHQLINWYVGSQSLLAWVAWWVWILNDEQWEAR